MALTISSFTFLFDQPVSGTRPTLAYTAREATSFEVCTYARFGKGTQLIMKSLLNGEPLGIGSHWIINNYRPDIDRVTVTPAGARRGVPTWQLTTDQVKAHFTLLSEEGL